MTSCYTLPRLQGAKKVRTFFQIFPFFGHFVCGLRRKVDRIKNVRNARNGKRDSFLVDKRSFAAWDAVQRTLEPFLWNHFLARCQLRRTGLFLTEIF